jgi:phosphopantetheinyl transferase
MTLNDDAWMRALFASRVHDWTPASIGSAARVMYAPFVDDTNVSRRCGSGLPECERRRAERFVTEFGRDHFKQRRAFRRFCGAAAVGSRQLPSNLEFKETASGLPYLPGAPDIWFSFSSCRFGFIGAWSATHAIGVDLEDQTRELDTAELARCYFTAAEMKRVEEVPGAGRRRAFFQLWTLKEAAMKSIGEGLPFGLGAFKFTLTPKLCVVHAPPAYGGRKRFFPKLFEVNEICAALVLRNYPDGDVRTAVCTTRRGMDKLANGIM